MPPPAGASVRGTARPRRRRWRRRALSSAAAAIAVLVSAALAFPPAAGAAASAWAVNPESRVRLVSPYRVAPRQGEIWLGLHFTLSPGWHVYWKNSGDAGLPPALDLAATPEISSAELRWPAPERYELPGGLVAYGYGEEVVYPVRARIRARIRAGTRARIDAPGSPGRASIAVSGRVDYLVCEVDCVPHGYDLSFEQPVGDEPEADPETAPLLERWRARLPVAAGALPGISSRARLDLADPEHPVLRVRVDGARPAGSEPTELFLGVQDLFEPGRPRLEPLPGGLAFRVPMDLRRTLAHPPTTVPFDWTVTGLRAAAPAGGGQAGGKEAPGTAGAVFALEAKGDVPVVRGGEGGTAAPAPGAGSRPLERPALATAAALLLLVALRLWGLLGRSGPVPGRVLARRQGLGFSTAGVLVWVLYRLAGRIDPVRLALAELALLVLALAAWLTGRVRRPAARRLAWALLVAAAGAAVWLAGVG